LNLVASENSRFQALDYQLQAARGEIRQAGLWSNPELGMEFEEVSWDAPGFRESEISVALAQEFEFFGQRGARKGVAKAQLEATELHVRLTSFDLYLITKRRFYALAHAQKEVHLYSDAVELAEEIAENIDYRLDKGAALQSELILAQLNLERTKLGLEEAMQDVKALEAELVSLWKSRTSGIRVLSAPEPDFKQVVDKLDMLLNMIDTSRQILQMKSELKILGAEKAKVIADARPTVTLSAGIKRLEADNSNSLLFGLSLPLPLLNRSQGIRESLDARQRSLEYDIEQGRIDAVSRIQSHTIQLKKLIDKHAVLDSKLLPRAEAAYRTLQDDYEAGRVPYTQLLEAERALNELNFEHNDMLLAIQEQIIVLESLTGVVMITEKEK
jgi:cobalt-zinc-cadmium efflux system outer membrane protein